MASFLGDAKESFHVLHESYWGHASLGAERALQCPVEAAL